MIIPSFCFPPESSLVTLDPLPRASVVLQIRSGTALTSPHYQTKKSRLVPSLSCFLPQGHSPVCFLDPGVRSLPCPLAYKSRQRWSWCTTSLAWPMGGRGGWGMGREWGHEGGKDDCSCSFPQTGLLHPSAPRRRKTGRTCWGCRTWWTSCSWRSRPISARPRRQWVHGFLFFLCVRADKRPPQCGTRTEGLLFTLTLKLRAVAGTPELTKAKLIRPRTYPQATYNPCTSEPKRRQCSC